MSKSTADIRHMFLDFFYNKGHQIISGSSLIPSNDPTLLFTNSGMNQFKDVFLGFEKLDCNRIATSQCCIRTGGKHNDLENVGYTVRHHTFFEMLGNFSFGDYFKYEAIQYAWELLTSANWFNISKERLWVTVYETDEEAYKIWRKEIDIPQEHIVRIGDNKGAPYASDNFWQMGDTGPCGPCTEIFYDHGDHVYGGPPGSREENGDRYIEIWNIVFMQFNRQIDGTMKPLQRPSVDTGMGLERIAAVLQCVNSNYEIDLFRTLIESVAKIVISTVNPNSKSLYVIADHIRSCAFLIAEGVIPSNENRGYVLRRIIRRAIRHGNMLGAKDIFFYKLVDPLIQVMESTGEIIKQQKKKIEQVLKIEEEQFLSTMEHGLAILNEELAKLKGNTLEGEVAFRLHDTYGFPIDLMADICRERNIKLDEVGFESAMKDQRYRARKSRNFNINYNIMANSNNISEFQGYNHLELNGNVLAIFIDNKEINTINAGQEAAIILDRTPFYPESGGQIGDKGELKGYNFVFQVNDTQKYGQTICHIGRLLSNSLEVGYKVQALVDEVHRTRICLNHTATHLMHAALRKILGIHVLQKGSLVDEKMLRFDFSHFQEVKQTEISAVENLVNEIIRSNIPIETNIMDFELAKSKGAIALFGEKYDKYVRVINIGDFSIELCGGTHALRTGDIGLFNIVSESSVAMGIRRIEAITGENAVANTHTQRDQLKDIMQLLRVNGCNLGNKLRNILKHTNQLEKELQQLKERVAAQESINLSSKAIEIDGVKLLVSKLTETDPKMLRIMVDNLKNQMDPIIVVLAAVIKNKVFLITGVSKDITYLVKAEELVNMIAQQVGGKGGGRPDMAQAGGTNVVALASALNSVEIWIRKKLQPISKI